MPILKSVIMYPMAFAAYNGTAIVKRVVSTQASSSSSFSSNYMEVYSTNIALKSLRTTNEGDFICPVTVCNYDQLDPTSPAKALINYTFTAELVKYNESTGEYDLVTTVQTKENDTAKTFYVQKIMDNNQTISSDGQHSMNSTGSFSYTYSSESLEGGSTLRDTYNICFDATEVAKDVPDLFIRVSAIPTSESQQQSGVSNLASVISISQGRIVETGWHGSLQETSTTDYDGYNFIIEGSGAGTIDILWDNINRVADAGDTVSPLLAKHMVGSNASTPYEWKVILNSSSAKSYSGVIYEMTDGAKVNLTFTDNSSHTPVLDNNDNISSGSIINNK